LQVPHRKGITQHRRADMLLGDPCASVESDQQERDRVRYESLMSLGEKEGSSPLIPLTALRR
jgi:hypothetical protein